MTTTVPKRHTEREAGTGRFASKPVRNVRPVGKGMGQYGSMVNPKLNEKKSKHIIDDISFSRDFIVCTCAWKGPIDAFQPHRKEVDPFAVRK